MTSSLLSKFSLLSIFFFFFASESPRLQRYIRHAFRNPQSRGHWKPEKKAEAHTTPIDIVHPRAHTFSFF